MSFSKLGISKAALAIFLVISLSLVLAAFHDHNILAGGEEGLLFYHPERSLKLYNSGWFETGTGYSTPLLIPRIVILEISNLFIQSGFQPWISQAVIFFLVFFLGLLYLYLLAKELLNSKQIELTATLAAIFYLLNLYTFSQIWGRFLYTQFFTFTLMPITTFYLLKFVKTPKYYYLILLGLLSFFCSFAFGTPAQVITIWSPAFLYLIYILVRNRSNKKEVIKFTNRFCIFLLAWLIFNLWWIYPYLVLSGSFNDVSSWKANYDSLTGVSQYSSTDQILLLRQSFLFGQGAQYFNFYSNPLINILSILALIIAGFGLLKSRTQIYGQIYGFYLFLLAFTGWFVSKGSNPPFGNILFSFLFSTFPFFQVLRNPYEKFGLVWVLAYSLCFAWGLSLIIERIKGFKKYLIASFIMFLVSGVLVWPLWSGNIFDSHRLTVPDSYQAVNEVINNFNKDGRILMLPIHKGDSATLDWGYSGTEPGEFLFDKPTISKRINLSSDIINKKFDQLVDALSYQQGLEDRFNELNIKYIVVRKDFKSEETNLIAQRFEATISALPEAKHVMNNDKLSLYVVDTPYGYFVADKSEVKLSYHKISPVKYLISVDNNSTESFNLIFKETYNNGWIARSGQTIFKHSQAYGYANSWQIKKKGSFQVQVYYPIWPWD